MRRTLFLLGLITVAAAFAHGEEAKREGHWGDFTGRIAYDGKPPLARTIIVPFGGAPLIDESLMVNVDNGGIANVVVTLVRSRHALLPAHPSYESEGEATVDLTIAAGRLDPHITLLRTTQLLQISNNLPGAANPKIDPASNRPANPLLEPGRSAQVEFVHVETTPVPI